ncbi:MAG: hypothetical protein ABF306_09755 [Nocardioides marinisabuli]|uniref:hypothetical protein n=1 Tax=Nocardioides marinisabuli TaxID=419476 RepID=UPI00321A23DE
MKDPEDFDAFYKDARERLLLQAYALTGDLPAARSSVRDGFVLAWHHWRKVSRTPSAEAWVRPHVWQHAHRRHTARVWHREKGLDPEVQATLEALGHLSTTQRRVLLLAHLASTSMPELAREVGMTDEAAARELQHATAQFSLHRQAPSTQTSLLLRRLATVTDEVRWPRASIVRRAGTARRRTHTLVGAVAAVAAVGISGTLLTEPAGLRPTLDRAAVTTPSAPPSPTAPSEGALAPAPDAEPLPESAMVPASAIAEQVPGRGWKVVDTTDNTAGDGLLMPCRASRYADPQVVDALVREFSVATAPDNGPKAEAKRVAWQATEVSRSRKAAKAGFRTVEGWYAGCTEGRTQLLSTRTVQGVGDEAAQMVLRDWADPVHTYVLGVARTGRYVTTTLTSVLGNGVENAPGNAELLGSAVDALCDLAPGGSCTGKVRLTPRDAEPVGDAPRLLVETDLPPVTTVDRPWVATRATQVRGANPAATRCDQTSFTGKVGGRAVREAATRTYLVPGAKLPVEFGLSETIGTLPARQAGTFVDAVRRKMASCEDRELGSEVVSTLSRSNGDTELHAWRVSFEVSDDTVVRYDMAVGRVGGRLMQVSFVPTPQVQMADGAFAALAERALERLRSAP